MSAYRIDDLTVEGRPVWFELGAGEVMGILKITAGGKRQYRVFASQDRPKLHDTTDLPRHVQPWFWRPVHPDRWPEPLPEPAVRLIPTLNLDAKAPNLPEGRQEGAPEWLDSRLRLNSPPAPPESVLEAEARVMRGVRTFDRLYNGEAHKLGYAIPSWLMGDNLGDPSDSTALPARWEPTARDVSDVEWGVLKWTAHLDRLDGEIIRLRAALIPWSYSQIGGVLKISRQMAHRRYRSAIRQVHRTALLSTI